MRKAELAAILDGLKSLEATKAPRPQATQIKAEISILGDALRRIEAVCEGEESERAAGMFSVLQVMTQTLTGLLASVEQGHAIAMTQAQTIAEAIAAIKIPQTQVTVEAPSVTVESPTVNVPAVPVSLTVSAGESHNHISVQPAQVTVQAAKFGKLKVDFSYSGSFISGATITRAED